MRLFVAVDVPPDVAASVEREIVDPLRDVVPGARWTRPQNRHLTLSFLGEVVEERVAEIAEAVGSAVRTCPAFGAAFQHLGGFPHLRRPRVLWVGLGPGADGVAALADRVVSALEPLGFPPESRPFRAHLTLARFPTPRQVTVPDVAVPTDPFRVDEVVLFRSQLHPKGARYTALKRFPLNDAR